MSGNQHPSVTDAPVETSAACPSGQAPVFEPVKGERSLLLHICCGPCSIMPVKRLQDEGFTVTPFPKTTGMKVAFLQSMTYDHNTGKLYHANYGAKTYYTTLVTYDLKTGLATVVDELYMAELCGMFIPRKGGSTFGPSEKIQEISLSKTDVSLIKGSSATLEVSAKPWTVVNRDCTWRSSNEAVATVSDGEIKAVGAGTCTITAASVLDPKVTAECTVTVREVDTTLDAVIWDSDSNAWFASFNTKTVPGFTKLTQEACKQQLMAVADAGGMTYAASYVEQEGSLTSALYLVGKDYSLEKIGDGQRAYTDLTWAAGLEGGTLLATCGQGILTVDPSTGDYSAAWNLSTLFGGAKLVGIAYKNTVNDTVNGLTDLCLVLDESGKLWQMGFYAGGSGLMCTLPELVADLGRTTGGYGYFSSLTTDGAYVYCTMWNGQQSDLMVLDLQNGAVANLGNFGAANGPVVGLRTTVQQPPQSAGETSYSLEGIAALPAQSRIDFDLSR